MAAPILNVPTMLQFDAGLLRIENRLIATRLWLFNMYERWPGMLSFCHPRATCFNDLHRDRWEPLIESVRSYYDDLNAFIECIRNSRRPTGNVYGDPPLYQIDHLDQELPGPGNALFGGGIGGEGRGGEGRGGIGRGGIGRGGIGRGGGFP